MFKKTPLKFWRKKFNWHQRSWKSLLRADTKLPRRPAVWVCTAWLDPAAFSQLLCASSHKKTICLHYACSGAWESAYGRIRRANTISAAFKQTSLSSQPPLDTYISLHTIIDLLHYFKFAFVTFFLFIYLKWEPLIGGQLWMWFTYRLLQDKPPKMVFIDPNLDQNNILSGT